MTSDQVKPVADEPYVKALHYRVEHSVTYSVGAVREHKDKSFFGPNRERLRHHYDEGAPPHA
jgi:hypothetical protein